MIYRNVLSDSDISELMDLYWRRLSKDLGPDQRRPQTYPSAHNLFIISEFTNDEVDFIWRKVKAHTGGELKYSRVLRYGPGGYADSHVDTGHSRKEDTNQSIIILLSDPDSFVGGDLYKGSHLVDLKKGDMVAWDYGVYHSVSPIEKGLRFVSNLRILV